MRPTFIAKLKDRHGNVLEESTPGSERVLREDTAFIMTHLLQEVVKYGTGWRARVLGRPVAGKTGTTDNQQDARFVEFTPTYSTVKGSDLLLTLA